MGLGYPALYFVTIYSLPLQVGVAGLAEKVAGLSETLAGLLRKTQYPLFASLMSSDFS